MDEGLLLLLLLRGLVGLLLLLLLHGVDVIAVLMEVRLLMLLLHGLDVVVVLVEVGLLLLLMLLRDLAVVTVLGDERLLMLLLHGLAVAVVRSERCVGIVNVSAVVEVVHAGLGVGVLDAAIEIHVRVDVLVVAVEIVSNLGAIAENKCGNGFEANIVVELVVTLGGVEQDAVIVGRESLDLATGAEVTILSFDQSKL